MNFLNLLLVVEIVVTNRATIAEHILRSAVTVIGTIVPTSPVVAIRLISQGIEQVWRNRAIVVDTWMHLSPIVSVDNRVSHCCTLLAYRQPYL